VPVLGQTSTVHAPTGKVATHYIVQFPCPHTNRRWLKLKSSFLWWVHAPQCVYMMMTSQGSKFRVTPAAAMIQC